MEDDCEERIAAAESLAQLQQGAYLESSSNDNNSQLQVFVEPTPLEHEFYEHEVFLEEPTQESKIAQHISIPDTQVVTYIDPTNAKPLGRDTSEYYKMPPGIKDPKEAIDWAKDTSLENMCVLVRNTQGSKSRFEMVYERSGQYKEKNSHKRKDYVYPKKTNRVYKTHKRKDNCPFKLVFHLNDKNNEWDCEVSFGRHNHRDPKDFVGHSLVAKLKPQEMEDVKRLTKIFIKPRQILRGFKEKDKTNVSYLSTIYSAQSSIRKVEWEGRSVMQEFEKIVWDYNYTRIIKRGSENKPLQIFISHPLLSQLAHC